MRVSDSAGRTALRQYYRAHGLCDCGRPTDEGKAFCRYCHLTQTARALARGGCPGEAQEYRLLAQDWRQGQGAPGATLPPHLRRPLGRSRSRRRNRNRLRR